MSHPLSDQTPSPQDPEQELSSLLQGLASELREADRAHLPSLEQFAQLRAQAELMELEEDELDGEILTLSEQDASRLINSSEAEEEEAYEDEMEYASQINNGGPDLQLLRLACVLGVRQTSELLEELAAE